MKRRIQVKISPIGEISIKAEGFRGKGCEAATRVIEDALGTRLSRTLTPAYHQSIAAPNTQKLEGGAR